MLFLRPLRIAFLVAGFLLGHWVAGVQERMHCAAAGGSLTAAGVCMVGNGK